MDLYLYMWIVAYVFYFITGRYLVPVLWRYDSHITLLTHCASSVSLLRSVERRLLFVWLAGKLADLTKEIDAALHKGIPLRRGAETFSFYSPPPVLPSHFPVCFFCDSRWNVPLHVAPSQVTDLTLQLSRHQEILELPERCSPRWNTTPTSRRKWRRNFRNSCNMAFTVNIFLATFAQSTLYIYFTDYVNILFKMNNKKAVTHKTYKIMVCS